MTNYDPENYFVLSLCDYSGRWAMPWYTRGYTVLTADIKRIRLWTGGELVGEWLPKDGGPTFGNAILMRREEVYLFVEEQLGFMPQNNWMCMSAPVCTMFSVAGIRWRNEEMRDGTYWPKLQEALGLVDACVRWSKDFHRWALENPRGFLRKWMGPPTLTFDPYEYAGWAPDPQQDRYTKKTDLWGVFNKNLRPNPLEPNFNMMNKYGGKSERTKTARSNTPMGFAEAFYRANYPPIVGFELPHLCGCKGTGVKHEGELAIDDPCEECEEATL